MVFQEISYVDNSSQAYQDGNSKYILLEIVDYRQDGQGCGFSTHVVVHALFTIQLTSTMEMKASVHYLADIIKDAQENHFAHYVKFVMGLQKDLGLHCA